MFFLRATTTPSRVGLIKASNSGSLKIIWLCSRIASVQPGTDAFTLMEDADMATMQSPTISNPAVLVPVNPEIERYMLSLVGRTDHPILADMEKVAKQNNFPIVGRLMGVFLKTLTRSIDAHRIFEFGSGYGYSAYWFAKTAGEDGRVICTDEDPHNKEKAEQYLKAADL